MAFWLESRMSRRPSSGCVVSVVSVSSPRTTCANHEPSRAQCFRRGPLLNTKEEDRFVMLSRRINVGARVGRLGAQRGSWRSTAGIQLLTPKLQVITSRGAKQGGCPQSLTMPSFEAAQRAAAAHVTESRQAPLRPAEGICFWAVCFRGGLFVVWGFGLEKAFSPFKRRTPQTPRAAERIKAQPAGGFPIPAPRPSSSENALR